MEQRMEFIRLHQAGSVSMAVLCRRFGISRQAGYRLLRRADAAEGADPAALKAVLQPRSRCPHHMPRRTDAEVEAAVLALRTAHPAWGGRKLARRLRDMGHTQVPAPSTVTAILRRHGRLDPAECLAHRPVLRWERAAPNQLWQMDFKGHFGTENGRRCHPLTVMDDHCRFNLGLRACADEQSDTVQQQLQRLFRRYGLPDAVLADNGSPWGTAGQDGIGLTRLGVWLMLLGVRVLHGRARHPQTQGKEERFHRTLVVELLQHRRFADLGCCQAAFDAFRTVYNEQRPHEALGLATPASRYRPSARCFPERLPAPEYHASDAVRRVGMHGYVLFRDHKLKLSQALCGQRVALRPANQDGMWQVFLSRFAVAQVHLGHPKPIVQPVTHLSEQV